MLTFYTIESLDDAFSFDFNQIHIANLQFEPNEKQKKIATPNSNGDCILCVCFLCIAVYIPKKKNRIKNK